MTAQEILRKALQEQMETEASEAPSTEQLRRMYQFSDRFLKYMEQLKKKEKKKERIWFLGWKDLVRKKTVTRIAAACIVCVIVAGSGWWGLHTFLGGSGDMGSGSTGAAADMAQAESAEILPEETPEDKEILPESSEESAGEYADSSGIWITADDILAVEVTSGIIEYKQNGNSSHSEAAQSLDADEKQTQELVTILNRMTLENVVSDEKTDDLPVAKFAVTKTDESVMNISVYGARVVIDGAGYEVEPEICEQLGELAKTIMETAGGK